MSKQLTAIISDWDRETQQMIDKLHKARDEQVCIYMLFQSKFLGFESFFWAIMFAIMWSFTKNGIICLIYLQVCMFGQLTFNCMICILANIWKIGIMMLYNAVGSIMLFIVKNIHALYLKMVGISWNLNIVHVCMYVRDWLIVGFWPTCILDYMSLWSYPLPINARFALQTFIIIVWLWTAEVVPHGLELDIRCRYNES